MALPPIDKSLTERTASSDFNFPGGIVTPLLPPINGTPRNDTLSGDGNETAEVVFGNAGDDTLTGGIGDYVYGGDGKDKITLNNGAYGFGEAGDDNFTINKGTGYGGDGNDTFVVKNGTAYGEGGNDRFLSYDAGDPNNQIMLYGGEGDDYFMGNGLTKTTAEGGAGNDTFDYYYAEGQLAANNGYVTIDGGVGNDVIMAAHGNLMGGEGVD